MTRENAVRLNFRKQTVAETLRLSQSWSVLDAEHVVMLRPKPHDFVLQSSRHYLALLDACRKDGETHVDDLPRSTLRDGRGKLIFIPAGCRFQGWAQPTTMPVAFTAAYIDPAFCSLVGVQDSQLWPMLHFEHHLLAEMMRHLDRVLAQPDNYSRLYAESFAVVLISEILVSQAVRPSHPFGVRKPHRFRGGLASWQRQLACDYIEQKLDQEISLAELAHVVGLSPFHFCRAFKEAVGDPPHRYQMIRRMARAKALLADRSLSISDVSSLIGYASPSRFSALFRKVTGHSPRTFRRSME